MSRSVKSLDEIRESRILFDKNPPAFGYILITVVTVFLIVAVVWSIKTPKTLTLKIGDSWLENIGIEPIYMKKMVLQLTAL